LTDELKVLEKQEDSRSGANFMKIRAHPADFLIISSACFTIGAPFLKSTTSSRFFWLTHTYA